jgi:MFS family permease
LIVLSFVFGVVDGFFMPAYQSIAPEMVAVDALPSANSLTGLSHQLSLLVGPLIGALFVATAGVSGAFAFDGLTFLASALACWSCACPHPRHQPGRQEPASRRGAWHMQCSPTSVKASPTS